jgi:hypothetical protein
MAMTLVAPGRDFSALSHQMTHDPGIRVPDGKYCLVAKRTGLLALKEDTDLLPGVFKRAAVVLPDQLHQLHFIAIDLHQLIVRQSAPGELGHAQLLPPQAFELVEIE